MNNTSSKPKGAMTHESKKTKSVLKTVSKARNPMLSDSQVTNAERLALVEKHLLKECTTIEIKKPSSSEDGKNGTDSHKLTNYVVDIPPTVLDAFKGMFEPNKTYRFRLTRVASIVTSGGGTMSLATGVYPGQFDQYTALAILFAQSRLIRTQIDYMLLQNMNNSTILPAVAVSAFDNAQYGGTTYLYNQLQRRAGAVQFTTAYTGLKVSNTFITPPSRRLWSNIATQSSTDPYGGNAGAWCISIANVASATTAYWEYLITADYEFTTLY